VAVPAAAGAAAAAAAADPHASGPMPAAALADGTVQLSTPGYGSSGGIKEQGGADVSGLQRDQAPHKDGLEWHHRQQAAAAAGGWGLGPGGHQPAGSKDIEAAAEDGEEGSVSPMGAGKAASFDDDASR
jgi:hypothetical protein